MCFARTLEIQKPWVESILLEVGVGKITTVDYTCIRNFHPPKSSILCRPESVLCSVAASLRQISVLSPPELARKYLSGDLPQFDGAVSFSSLEHSGLGRYGDTLNPFGDLVRAL